jgi:hypothetical protein
MRVDVAGLHGVGVVDLEGEDRDNNAEEGKSGDQITHIERIPPSGAGDESARFPSIA